MRHQLLETRGFTSITEAGAMSASTVAAAGGGRAVQVLWCLCCDDVLLHLSAPQKWTKPRKKLCTYGCVILIRIVKPTQENRRRRSRQPKQRNS